MTNVEKWSHLIPKALAAFAQDSGYAHDIIDAFWYDVKGLPRPEPVELEVNYTMGRQYDSHGDNSDGLARDCQCLLCGAARWRKNNIKPGVVLENVPHGTTTAYSKGCRCDDCRTANRDQMRAYRAEGPKPPRIPKPKVVKEPRQLMGHGTTACYKRGCRCDECKAAQSVLNRKHRERRKGNTNG